MCRRVHITCYFRSMLQNSAIWNTVELDIFPHVVEIPQINARGLLLAFGYYALQTPSEAVRSSCNWKLVYLR